MCAQTSKQTATPDEFTVASLVQVVRRELRQASRTMRVAPPVPCLEPSFEPGTYSYADAVIRPLSGILTPQYCRAHLSQPGPNEILFGDPSSFAGLIYGAPPISSHCATSVENQDTFLASALIARLATREIHLLLQTVSLMNAMASSMTALLEGK